jgi:hypothetical protein
VTDKWCPFQIARIIADKGVTSHIESCTRYDAPPPGAEPGPVQESNVQIEPEERDLNIENSTYASRCSCANFKQICVFPDPRNPCKTNLCCVLEGMKRFEIRQFLRRRRISSRPVKLWLKHCGTRKSSFFTSSCSILFTLLRKLLYVSSSVEPNWHILLCVALVGKWSW